MAICTKCGADSNHINDVGVCPAEFGGGWIDNVKEGDRFRVNKTVPAAWLERDDRPSLSPSYTLKEIGELAQRYTREFQCSVDDELGTFLELSRFIAWLAKREREGLDGA